MTVQFVRLRASRMAPAGARSREGPRVRGRTGRAWWGVATARDAWAVVRSATRAAVAALAGLATASAIGEARSVVGVAGPTI